ncbi:MAG: hypothetical protein KGI60_03935 [Patescibacteria group bacterium]|nr:hypothetical protein [Patescibacteria group bacterium]
MKTFTERIRYPKFTLLLLTLIIGYGIFRGQNFQPFRSFLASDSYLNAFLAGLFFVYSFTAGPATATLVLLGERHSILVTGLVAGAGALAGDLLIFKFIRFSFRDEIDRLSRTRPLMAVHRAIPDAIRGAVMLVIGLVFIASPLPDEIGVALVASYLSIETRTFAVLSYVLNTAGIFALLYASRFFI